jgi:hypothetical protein
MVNILVYTISPFNFVCGGLVVQYELCRFIDSLGFNIRIYAPEQIPNSIFSKYYNNDFDLNQTIVIYGETIPGNPLNAPYIVRWILAPLGISGESQYYTWNDTDLVYFFNCDKLFLNDETKINKIYKTLTSIYINPLINNYNDPNRKGYCHTYRKYHYHQILKYAHPPNHSQEITRNHKFLECIQIFNKREIFISYDPLTFLNIMAAMCGCISVVIKVDDMTEDDWIKTTVAYPYLQSKNLNIAYETLSKEGKRLKYILQSLGIEIEEIKMNPELTEYIFELREDISDCETESELNSKIHDVEIELREVRDMIENEVQKGINGKVDTRTLCELFCKFKCLKEVIKSHKKQAV